MTSTTLGACVLFSIAGTFFWGAKERHKEHKPYLAACLTLMGWFEFILGVMVGMR